MYGPKVVPTTTGASPGLVPERTSLVLKTAVVPDAVTVDVAPAAPTPPNTRGFQTISCAFVGLAVLTAVRVKVVVVCAVLRKDPTTVPLVNGVVSVRGLSIESVFVMFALIGRLEYEAVNDGFVTVAPISTVLPPEKVTMEKPGVNSSNDIVRQVVVAALPETGPTKQIT